MDQLELLMLHVQGIDELSLNRPPSSGFVGCHPIGLSLTKSAASKHTNRNSENVKTYLPNAHEIAFFIDLINDSEHPFHQDPTGVVKCHMPLHSYLSTILCKLLLIKIFYGIFKLFAGGN